MMWQHTQFWWSAAAMGVILFMLQSTARWFVPALFTDTLMVLALGFSGTAALVALILHDAKN